jgi:hypothetical protein
MNLQGLGCRPSPDKRHIERYRLSAILPTAVAAVERTLPLPRYRSYYDQQQRNACVGYSSSWMMSILNRRRYDSLWLWDRAKEIDEWSDTNPGDNEGTSVRAAMDVLRKTGHKRVERGESSPPDLQDGILENRWATTVDEIRTCISNGIPVILALPWYENFYRPEQEGKRHWIGRGDLGKIKDYHAICAYRASDRLQAIGLVNTWGSRYPMVMIPYGTLRRLLSENAEATVVTDRP